jgi:hypothetical protein
MSTYLCSTEEVVIAYKDLRSRVLSLSEKISADDEQKIVPATPQWNVQQLLCHIVGVPEDILAGRMEGVTSDAWTDAQVELFKGLSVSELMNVFQNSATPLDEILPMIPQPVISQFVMDAVTHEHDLRGAMKEPGARDSVAVDVALGFLFQLLAKTDVPLLQILLASSTPRWDIFRSLTGRRTIIQMNDLGLPGEAIAIFVAGLPFEIPAQPTE